MPATAPPQTSLLQASIAADVSAHGVTGHALAVGHAADYADSARATRSAARWFAVYADLFKARLTSLVLLTTLVGFYVGFRGPVDYALMFHVVMGTALVASGASALNQLMEREYDGKMRRTQDRPLPAKHLQPHTVLLIGCVTAIAGLAYLAQAVNVTTCILGAITLGSYLFLYTPLKRVTWVNTLVGAVPGALPPLMGWTAARGGLSTDGVSLFLIQAFWQIPHFMAIAWIYRQEYAKAGFQMLPVVDPQGHRTARLGLICTLVLLPVSLWPVWAHLAGTFYLVGAVVLGLSFFWCALQFARATRQVDTPATAFHGSEGDAGTHGHASLPDKRAWQLFYLSLLYLPLLMTLMVLNKIN